MTGVRPPSRNPRQNELVKDGGTRTIYGIRPSKTRKAARQASQTQFDEND
ncbi:hypothetical protein [Corynebacterium sp. H130]